MTAPLCCETQRETFSEITVGFNEMCIGHCHFGSVGLVITTQRDISEVAYMEGHVSRSAADDSLTAAAAAAALRLTR